MSLISRWSNHVVDTFKSPEAVELLDETTNRHEVIFCSHDQASIVTAEAMLALRRRTK